MALRYPSDRWIARHLRNQIEILRYQSRPQTHLRRRDRGFVSGMAGPDNQNVKTFCKLSLHGSKPIKITFPVIL